VNGPVTLRSNMLGEWTGTTITAGELTNFKLMVVTLHLLAVFSDSQAAIRRMEHLEPGPGQPLAR